MVCSKTGDFDLQGTFASVWRHFWLSQLGKVLLASSGWWPGRLLHVPSAQDSSQQQRIIQPKCQ